ncbi:MAG: hypothetical protein AAGD10_10495 [Myxococcota bacterium]
MGVFLEAPGDTVDLTLNWNLTSPERRAVSDQVRPTDFNEVPRSAIIESSLADTGIELLDNGSLRVPLPTDTVGFFVDVDPSALPSFCHRLSFLIQLEGRSEFFEVRTDGWTLPLLEIQPTVEVLTEAEIQENSIVSVDEWPKIQFSPAEGLSPGTLYRGCDTRPIRHGDLQGGTSWQEEPLDMSLLEGLGDITTGTHITGFCFAYYLDTRVCEDFWELTQAEREESTHRVIHVDFLAP